MYPLTPFLDHNIRSPPEIVCGNELDTKVKEVLPQEASFTPKDRTETIEEVKRFLKPGAQKSKGGSFLPALGVHLKDDRLKLRAEVLPIPFMKAANMNIPSEKGSNWTSLIAKVRIQFIFTDIHCAQQ